MSKEIVANPPQPYRLIGQACLTVEMLTFFLIMPLDMFRNPYNKDEIFLAAIGYVCVVFSMLFMIPPFFFGKYPSWMVRLIGERYINNLLADVQRLMGEERLQKATLKSPFSWFDDGKVVLPLLLILAALLGVLAAL
jgi:hypothetical protein